MGALSRTLDPIFMNLDSVFLSLVRELADKEFLIEAAAGPVLQGAIRALSPKTSPQDLSGFGG